MTLLQALRNRRLATAAEPASHEGFAYPSDLMAKIDAGYGVLAGMLTCPMMRACADMPATGYERRMSDVAQAASDARLNGKVSHQIKSDENGTTVYIDMPEIMTRVFGLPPQATSEQAGQHAHAMRILKGVMPNLDLDRVGSEGGMRVRSFTLPEDTGRDLPLEALSAINVPDVAKLDLGDWNPPLRGSVTFVIQPISVRTTEATDRITDHVDMILNVRVRCRIVLPRAYCEWAQHSNGDDYVPLATWLHFNSQRHWFSGSEGATKPEQRVPHPDVAATSSGRARQKYGVVGKPRTDVNGICVLPSGSWIYVPTVPDASVSGMMRECISDDQVNLDPIRNRHVFTDWVLGKMGVSDTEGTMHLVDLTGARPPSPAVIAHVADWPIKDDMLASMTAMARKVGVPVMSSPAVGLENIQWSNLMDVPYYADDEEGSPKQRANLALFDIGKRFGEVYTALSNGNVPLWEQFEVRPYLAMFGPYASGRAAGVRQLGDQVAHNRMGIDTSGDVDVKLNNMPGVEGVMPHQRRVLGTLSTNPLGAILDVRAGGGKSLAAIHDITDLMAKNLIHRPVVIMPRNLLGNFASEVIKFTGGRLRPFIISNRVWRAFERRIGSNPMAVIDLMKRQPRNTVFLVDYGWLTHNADPIEFGEDRHDFFPHAALLQELEPDYCCLDESHRAKKIGSGRTMAAAMITGIAKYRRIMSGTLLHNTAVDLVGQMAQIEPMALGALGDTIKANRRVAIADLPELDRAKSAFARSISVPRKEWAHLLPPLIERVHPCQMTPKQKEFYVKIYERLQAEIQNDPKFKALMKSDSKNAEARILAIMKRKFVPLEQWLNAPDSQYSANQFGQVFSQLSGLSEEDLRSPKIPVLDELLRQHLEGAEVDTGHGDVENVPASGNKAIVFCFNKAVTEHVFRHSKYAHMGVLYQAGDDAALDRFKNDPSVIFLYAAVTSMAEGHNLQMADRVITMQSYWTPGLGEQAMARVWRPDVPDKDGNIKYKRDRIWSDQILITPSVEVAKMARLISKQLSNLLVEEIDSSPSLKKIVRDNESTFEKLKPVKMSLDTLKKLQDQDALSTYFRGYALVKQWELKEFAEARNRVRAEVEAKVGHRVTNSQLSAASMTRPVNQDTPDCNVQDAMQAQGYVPWVEGFTGYNPTGLKLMPLEMPKPVDEDEDEDATDTDTDEDDGDEEELVHVDRGDPVWTEYGPGEVVTARRGSKIVTVKVPGFREEPFRLMRYVVLAATNPTDKRALEMILKKAGSGGLPTLQLGPHGELAPTKSPVPADQVLATKVAAERSLKEPVRTDRIPRTGTPTNTRRPAATVEATRADLTRERGRITIGNHEAVLMRGKNTGTPAWIVRHQNDPRDRSRPYMVAEKRLAVDDLLRRHNEAQAAPVAGRSRGLRADDPHLTPKPKPQRGMPVSPMSLVQPATTPAQRRAAKKAAVTPILKPLSLMDVTQHEEERDVREASAGVFSGTVCLVTTDGGDRDPLLLKSGFDRLAKRLEFRVKNPKAYRAFVQMLIAKFDMPAVNQKALLTFADQYQAAKSQVAYLKAKELPQHQLWLKQQRAKGKLDNSIMPWPLVRGGLVYVVINVEQIQGKAASLLKRLQPPIGVMKPVVAPAQMIAMLQSITAAKSLMKTMKQRGVDLGDQAEILAQLRRIKG